jgi:hypothetical protein
MPTSCQARTCRWVISVTTTAAKTNRRVPLRTRETWMCNYNPPSPRSRRTLLVPRGEARE